MKIQIAKPVYAEIVVDLPEDPLGGRYASVGSIFGAVLNIVFWIVTFIATVYIVISALKIATAWGDKIAIQNAKKSLTYAVLGFFIAVTFRGGLEVIANIIGITLPPILPNF